MTGCKYGSTQCSCWGGTWHCNNCPGSASGGSGCGNNGAVCQYGATVCGCEDYDWKWYCGTCPASKPADESGCSAYRMVCAYGSSYCRCRWNNGPKWDCT